VRVHDFIDAELGKAIPYGVYDVARNEGWVNVGIDHDTAEFAVESIWRSWCRMGRYAYPNASELLITADKQISWRLELRPQPTGRLAHHPPPHGARSCHGNSPSRFGGFAATAANSAIAASNTEASLSSPRHTSVRMCPPRPSGHTSSAIPLRCSISQASVGAAPGSISVSGTGPLPVAAIGVQPIVSKKAVRFHLL
jgi:hypothetical protein